MTAKRTIASRATHDVKNDARMQVEKASHRAVVVVDQGAATIPNGKRYIGVILVTEDQASLRKIYEMA